MVSRSFSSAFVSFRGAGGCCCCAASVMVQRKTARELSAIARCRIAIITLSNSLRASRTAHDRRAKILSQTALMSTLSAEKARSAAVLLSPPALPMKLIDVTVPLDRDLPVYPGNTPFVLEPVKRIARGDSSNVSTLHMSAHAGTHVDAPR